MTQDNVPIAVGQHVFGELMGVSQERLDDEDYLRGVLVRALHLAGATVCDVVSKHFQPQGVTVLVLLAESHASIHTYPESGSMFVDIFTCGNRANPEEALRLLAEALEPTVLHTKKLDRVAMPTVSATLCEPVLEETL